MHVNEIKAFASKVAMDRAWAGKGTLVVIRAPQSKGGMYISPAMKFEATKETAKRFNYDVDKVGDQIETCIANGMPLEVELAD